MLYRSRDIFFSIMFLLFIFPLLLLLFLINYINIGRPVIFHQKRPGLHGESFKFYKFRTMTNQTDKAGNLLHDDKRLTSFGDWLRKTSLDELPSFWNVIKGTMSLVGPRPLLMEYLPLYSKEQSRRHLVKPGITGWAQINGRNAISWEEKFKLDVWYVDNQAALLDMKILIMTIWKVLKREGVSPNNNRAMPKFKGTIIE